MSTEAMKLAIRAVKHQIHMMEAVGTKEDREVWKSALIKLEEVLAKQEQVEWVCSKGEGQTSFTRSDAIPITLERPKQERGYKDGYEAGWTTALNEAYSKQEQGEPVAWACWLDSQNPETDKPVVVQYEPLAYSKRRPLIYTTLQHPKQEPVAWAGYNLDDMCDAFDRVIEEHHYRKNPFHDPVNRDAMLALRILRGFVPYMKRYTTPQQRTWVGLTDEDLRELGFSSRPRWWPALEAKLKELNT